jgi:alkylation response protein AidB-like acyl-CoA dehydrogenase
VEFGPDETQRRFDRLLRDLLAARLPVEELRRFAAAGQAFAPALWEELARIGLAGVLVPEAQGGAGLGCFEAALAAEALGYHAAPLPFAAAAVMAPLALRESAAGRAWLSGIADGSRRCAVLFEAGLSGETGAGRVERREGRLSGRLATGLDAAGATHLVLVLADGALVGLEASGPGVSLGRRPGLDPTRPPAEVVLDGAPARLLWAPEAGRELGRRVLDAGRVMLAADTLGAAQHMLDRAVAHARQREQFGRLIGSFQAVKHMCAEMAAMLEPCRALVWYAAHAQDAGLEDARLAACHAKAHLGEVGREVARMATEVHGGMGFTDELGLHLWFKRIGAARQLLGGPEHCRRDAARLQGLGAG